VLHVKFERRRELSCSAVDTANGINRTGYDLYTERAAVLNRKLIIKLTNRKDFAVVCSVIDTQHDVIMWEEQKSGHEQPRRRVGHFLFFPHIMVSYYVPITEQTTVKSYLSVLYNVLLA
jgi:hypothetical protein